MRGRNSNGKSLLDASCMEHPAVQQHLPWLVICTPAPMQESLQIYRWGLEPFPGLLTGDHSLARTSHLIDVMAP